MRLAELVLAPWDAWLPLAALVSPGCSEQLLPLTRVFQVPKSCLCSGVPERQNIPTPNRRPVPHSQDWVTQEALKCGLHENPLEYPTFL